MNDILSEPILTYVIPIAIALLVLGLIYYYSKKQRKPSTSVSLMKDVMEEGEVEEKEEDDADKPPILARIYSVERRFVGNREIPWKIAKEIIRKSGNLGRQWLREGKKIYAFKLENNEYTPVKSPDNKGYTPRDLGNALNQDEISGWYRPQQPQGAFSKYGPILIWTGAIIFIIFMMIAQ